LPRLWKSEPESTEEESTSTKKARKEGDDESSQSSAKSRAPASKGKTKSAKGQGSSPAGGKAEKKVLIEDTPALDTYESRRRARLIMGGLVSGWAFLVVWIVYRAFLYDPVPIDMTASGDPAASQSGPETRLSLDHEARFMYNRAQEFAKGGRTEQALAMLNRVIKVYKGTPTAKDSQAALDRAGRKLPLFSDRPVVVAESEEPQPQADPAPPPAVVVATPPQPQPAQGQATLVLPANPSEGLVAPPSAPAGARTSKVAITPRAVPQGFQANLDAGIDDSGWPLVIVGDRDGSPMVLVPGGTFTMGCNDGQPAEAPAHQVRLSTYYIDQHEVTNRQFRIFLSEAHYHGQPAGKWLTDTKVRAEPENLPVAHVNYHDAVSFATWAGKQLPTEAQWELAARSADGRKYPWGDEPPKWSKERASRQIDSVMSFPEDKSPYGVFDMAGNAHEWTTDWFDSKYYQLFTNTTVDNPAGPNPSSRSRTPQHVVRGASKNWSVTYREGVPPDRRLPYLGFRCVLAVEGQGPAPAAGNPASPRGNPSKDAPIPF